KLTGSDPKLRDEAVLYTAHHDHLGIGRPDDRGDTIYNGAIDNASGCAILLDLAHAWANTKPAPKRSIYFASVAAEEQGLLGSADVHRLPRASLPPAERRVQSELGLVGRRADGAARILARMGRGERGIDADVETGRRISRDARSKSLILSEAKDPLRGDPLC